MNPVVLIAMYGRKQLIDINISILRQQKCQIVIITSTNSDGEHINYHVTPDVHKCIAPNQPLGRKWQMGVDYCRKLGANPLIILGSDDFLSSDFVEKAVKYQGVDFIFFTQWYIHEINSRKNYFLKYKNCFPLGSARVFSKAFLDKNDWKIYDSHRERLLDDYAFDIIKHDDNVLMNPEGMNLLSIKGNWEVMNSLERILQADTIEWREEQNIDHHFNFEKPIKEIFI